MHRENLHQGVLHFGWKGSIKFVRTSEGSAVHPFGFRHRDAWMGAFSRASLLHIAALGLLGLPRLFLQLRFL
eukprot:NODE_1993_length_706_cov_16.520548_g1681_i0.p2 GENE.NODE_1993_length_706_cov_16.520548_g1681_i0~~NODE_1993_length_706_cov_16.520548_g1681_i0.p2  ORF type:complete len:72 (-),score=3.94 NODE_1993_length_706_cov_16.520548_g1681_i0:82-297(-)